MHPAQHAISSVMRFGGVESDYLDVHRWFDATKVTFVHFTHRALRHHTQGIEECARVRGETLLRASDGKPMSVADLGRQHCSEDCGGHVPEAADWLARLDLPDWLPSKVPSAEEMAASSARRFGGVEERYLPLHAWFLETEAWWQGPDARHLAMRHHAFGIFEAEERFGVTLNAGEGIQVPVRYLGERHVRAVLARVPPASDWLRRIRGEAWMSDAMPRPGGAHRGVQKEISEGTPLPKAPTP